MPWTPKQGEWWRRAMPDVYPFGPLRIPQETGRVLFGVHRYACPTPDTFVAHWEGRLPLSGLELIRMWRNRRVPDPAGLQGYFQLWRYAPEILLAAIRRPPNTTWPLAAASCAGAISIRPTCCTSANTAATGAAG